MEKCSSESKRRITEVILKRIEKIRSVDFKVLSDFYGFVWPISFCFHRKKNNFYAKHNDIQILIAFRIIIQKKINLHFELNNALFCQKRKLFLFLDWEISNIVLFIYKSFKESFCNKFYTGPIFYKTKTNFCITL